MSEQERVIQAVSRLAELRPMVEQAMEDAWGEDWVDERRRRAEAQGHQISLTSGPHDPRFLLSCIAFEEPLQSIFSEHDRQRARDLTTIANRAYHHDLDRLRPVHADTAADTVDRLIAVGEGQPSFRRLTVGTIIDRAKAEAASEQERLGQEEAERVERVAEIRRVLSTFVRVMREVGDPGAITADNGMVRKTVWTRFQDVTWKFSGWLMATYERRMLGPISCFLSTDGNLWLCDERGVNNPSIRDSLDLEDEAMFDARDGYWTPVPANYDPRCGLDQAIVTRIGELCIEHDVAWPDD